MNTSRGSKNSIENRGKKAVMMCTTCGEERKPLRVMGQGKNRMGYECKCGLLDKKGEALK